VSASPPKATRPPRTTQTCRLRRDILFAIAAGMFPLGDRQMAMGIGRRELMAALGGVAVAWPLPARAQQAKVPRLGFLGPASPTGFQVEALRAGLRDFGYVEGRNLAIEYRFANGQYDRLPTLANELVRLNVDVIVTHSTPGTQAAKAATSTIPIVMAVAGDATALGLVSNLARPGGNVTGSTFFNPELMAKRLELLKELPTPMFQIAVLSNTDNPVNEAIFPVMEETAKPLSMKLTKFYVRGPGEFERAFADIANQKLDAVVIVDDPILIVNAKALALQAISRRIPSISHPEFGAAGGLMAYGVNLYDLFRRSGYFVDRILKGTSPGDLPVEQPTKFELVINLTTAKSLDINIPPTLLARADRVIE
jgi:putative tryptophan/tyrosine transport system substrate-binding protein